ncbi:hypothetical protein HJFPF1_02252 [Paramyrothecium foliicola]|nr:hypothetical protein HJFPF1_02252 [Paramyrothecium foliicola]
MVLFSTLFLAATATLSVAYPSKIERSNIISARAPTLGQELTLQKTVNQGDGTFTSDGGDVIFKVGDKIGEGSKGVLFAIDCGGRPECDELGRVVLKYYTDTDAVEGERSNLARINELKAVGINGEDQFSLLVFWEGTNFSKLPKYLELLEDEEDNADDINKLLDSAIEKISEDVKAYAVNNLIYHGDISDANVLLVESDGEITSAKVVDWDDANILEPEQIDDDDKIEALTEDIRENVANTFNRFRADD